MQQQRITIGTFMGRVRRRSYNAIVGLAALSLLLGLGFYTPASAHCIVGNRFFPATINVDDPCVADELSLPTIAGFKNGDDPSARVLDICAQGFDNLGTSFKYQFVGNAGAERAMSI